MQKGSLSKLFECYRGTLRNIIRSNLIPVAQIIRGLSVIRKHHCSMILLILSYNQLQKCYVKMHIKVDTNSSYTYKDVKLYSQTYNNVCHLLGKG